MTECSKGIRLLFVIGLFACSDDESPGTPSTPDASMSASTGKPDPSRVPPDSDSGVLRMLTYNVAGLPELLSSSMPHIYTAQIGPLLNDYSLVLLQESWKTPEDNPLDPTRVYHEILEEASEHLHTSESAPQPFNEDPMRPSAIISDGLNRFSDYPFGEITRVRWNSCWETAADCLAIKGFSHARTELSGGIELDVYNLHMEAGGAPEDVTARDEGIDQLVEFIKENSEDRAIVVGGDFNLHTGSEPAASQFARLLAETGLRDVCAELSCGMTDSIDKILYRSTTDVHLDPSIYNKETDVFLTEDGLALSDHDALHVTFIWSAHDD